MLHETSNRWGLASLVGCERTTELETKGFPKTTVEKEVGDVPDGLLPVFGCSSIQR